jgi:(2Fe-2S) ferredoxin
MAIKNLERINLHLFLCNGGTCTRKGAEGSTLAIRQKIAQLGFQDQVHTTKTLCNGRCENGPVVIACPQNHWYEEVTADVGEKLVESLLQKKEPLQEHLFFTYPENQFDTQKNNTP